MAVPVLNALTIDVEDYFQVSAFENDISRADWDRYQCRVVGNTHCLLELLRGHGVHGTFFVLGWIAERYPELVREIRDAGHEIGSHGYWHRLIYRQTPQEFRDDLRRSRDLLQDVSGAPSVCLPRACSFSITQRSLWPWKFWRKRDSPRIRVCFPSITIVTASPVLSPDCTVCRRRLVRFGSFPLKSARLARSAFPSVAAAISGYFHWLGARTGSTVSTVWKGSHSFSTSILGRSIPSSLIACRSPLSRWRHYVNLSKNREKLAGLLRRFRFGPLSEVIANHAN